MEDQDELHWFRKKKRKVKVKDRDTQIKKKERGEGAMIKHMFQNNMTQL